MLVMQQMQSQSRIGLMILLTFQLSLPILSTDIYLPSLNDISNFYHATHEQVAHTLTAYFLIFGIVQLFYGPLSDRFGRRPMLLFSSVIYVMATLFCVFATSIQMLIIARCLQALGAGSAILTFAIIRDLYEGEYAAKMIAYMSAVVAMSPIIAPIVGGYIQVYLTWQLDFVILAIFEIVLLVLCYQFLPETNQHAKRSGSLFTQSFKDYQVLATNRYYLAHSLSAAGAFGALFAYVSGAPYVLLNLMGYSAQAFSYLFAIASSGYVVGALVNGQLICRFGFNAVYRIGMTSLISGVIIMMLMCQLYPFCAAAIVVPQILCEFGIAIVVPISITRALLPIPHHAGSGAALIGFLRFGFATMSSYLVTEFQGTTSLSLACVIFIFAMFSWYCLKIS
ncbi:Bcr/CflA family multidrug efflux MFS transporter [soil metagenome]